MFKLVAVIKLVLPVKFKFLNQLPDSIKKPRDPAFTVKSGAFEVVPPVVPKATRAPSFIKLPRVKPPVPVQEKLVALAITRTEVDAKVEVNAILPVPK